MRLLAQGMVERALWLLSSYGVPMVVAAFTLLALLLWDDSYHATAQRQLQLHVLPETSSTAGTPAVPDILRQIRNQPPQMQYETHLSEKPIWFLVEPRLPDQSVAYLEIPSRHLRELRCWDTRHLNLVGYTTQDDPIGQLMRSRSGYALKISSDGEAVLCQAYFQGPAKLKALLWSPGELELASNAFHRKSGLLDGGILMLAAFALVVAAVSRNKLYIVFAAWLVLTLRVASTAIGWDNHWLNHEVPADWLPDLRSVTRALWAIVTVTLFKALLDDELTKTKTARLLPVVQWLCLGLLVTALLLPRDMFLISLWSAGTVALSLALIVLVDIVWRTRSMVALWYCAALTVTLLSGLTEIAAAALGWQGLTGVLNTHNAALSSALLAALAIAELMRQEHHARLQAQLQLQHTYDVIPVGMFTLDLQGTFTRTNPAMKNMLAPRFASSQHRTWPQYFGVKVWQELLDRVQRQKIIEMEFGGQPDPTSDEAPRRYLLQASLSSDKIEGTLQDVTEKSVAIDRLNFLADNDALTKVMNRRGMEKIFQALIAKVDDKHPMTLAYMDLDRFKLINDLYGHNAGDEVLRQVCLRITALLPSQFHLGRVGGDEFVLMLPETHMSLAAVICRGVIDSIEGKPFKVDEKAFHVRISIGLVAVSPHATLKEVLTTSDRACHEAKRGQHRGLVVFERDTSAFQEYQAQLDLIGALSGSDIVQSLYLEMQPVMSLTHPNDAMNFEVLLRLRGSNGQEIPVSRLISAAETCGRMSMLDRWVLTQTLAWLDRNRPMLQRVQFVCLNLSGASLNDEVFLQEVFELLQRNSHVTPFLCFEITESVALHDLKNTRRFIHRARGYGARVALDDFGAGYSSFSYLKDLPADLLKIDGSLVVHMNHHPANISIVEAIVNLARNLGMKTVAEWAEDVATVQTLAELGVDYVQGHAVASPMPPEKLLTGRSAASFVEHPILLQLIASLSKENRSVSQLDLLGDDDSAKQRFH